MRAGMHVSLGYLKRLARAVCNGGAYQGSSPTAYGDEMPAVLPYNVAERGKRNGHLHG